MEQNSNGAKTTGYSATNRICLVDVAFDLSKNSIEMEIVFWWNAKLTCRNISPSAKMLALVRETMGLNEGVNTMLCLYYFLKLKASLIRTAKCVNKGNIFSF